MSVDRAALRKLVAQWKPGMTVEVRVSDLKELLDLLDFIDARLEEVQKVAHALKEESAMDSETEASDSLGPADRALREALTRLQDVGFILDELPMEGEFRRGLQTQITEAGEYCVKAVTMAREEAHAK